MAPGDLRQQGNVKFAIKLGTGISLRAQPCIGNCRIHDKFLMNKVELNSGLHVRFLVHDECKFLCLWSKTI